MSHTWARAIKACAALLLALPLFALLQEALVLLVSRGLGHFFRAPLVAALVEQMVISPVHARLLIDTAGAIEPQGMALAGLPGELVHQLIPALFRRPDLVEPGAWVSALLGRDSSVISLFVTATIVQVMLILVGGLLARQGAQDKRIWTILTTGRTRELVLFALGVLVQALALADLFRLTHAPDRLNLHDTGIGFALSILWRVEADQYAWLMDALLPNLIPAAVGGLGLALAFLAGRFLDRQCLFSVAPQPRSAEALRARLLRAALPLALAPLLLITAYPSSWFGLARTRLVALRELHSDESPSSEVTIKPGPDDNGKPPAASSVLALPADVEWPAPLPEPPSGTNELDGVDYAPAAVSLPDSPREQVPPRRWGSDQIRPGTRTPAPTQPPPVTAPTFVRPAVPAPAGVRRVGIVRTTWGLGITLDDRPVMMMGMNYNADYTTLPLERKRYLHHRDFRTLRDAGVNAVIGWGVYDDVTLQIAQEYGVGVIMPFDLDPNGAFGDAGYREKVRGDYRAFVDRFRASPALWGWNPGGDELLHRMETEQHRTREQLQAAADLLLDLGELGFRLDPYHVTVVKDARDSYLPYVERSIQAARAERGRPNPSQYLVYAANLYGRPDDVAGALLTARRNVHDRLGLAFLVGEYAPFGLARQDRPGHYGMLWDIVSVGSRNGGFAYVYGPDQPNFQGPNPYDPLRLLVNDFSMVDSNGTPIDDALAVLSSRWHRASVRPSAP